MRVVMHTYLSSRTPEAEWALFDKNGENIPLPDLKSSEDADVVVSLSSGIYWLLQANDDGAQVRYFILTDEYPTSSEETLETGLTSDFLLIMRDAEEVAQIRKIFEEDLEKHPSRGDEPRQARYPKPLRDAICAVLKRVGDKRKAGIY